MIKGPKEHIAETRKKRTESLFCGIQIAVLIFSVLFSGCAQKEKYYKNTFLVAGTFVEVTSNHKEAFKIVRATMEDLEKRFNLYDKNSEISRLNSLAGIEPLEVSDSLLEILKLSKTLNQLTDGAFDPSIGAAIAFWKEKIKNKKLEKFPDNSEIKKLSELKGMNYIEFDENKGTAFITKKGVSIDLGGIAKGYMIDKAALALRKNSIDSALINAGGDMFCLGQKDLKPWRIGIRDPKAVSDILDTLKIVDEAVATSGDYEQFFEYDRKKYSHIIDPATCLPSQSPLRSVTVIAHNATTADGLATAFFIMGKEKIQQFLNANRSNLKIFLVEDDNDKLSIHCLGPIF
ncbi:MAG: FAD:protein FMN transferase [Candidatus Omnitrophica bacterium]|nr:FAD:protein FMN transferase [Candidatus Omnitrophota bacterium]